MATMPAHYIRTIHTSFTAAHPRNAPSAWASAAAAPRYTPAHGPSPKDKDSMHLQHPHPQQQHQPLQNASQFNQYPQQHPAAPQYGVSVNTHNQHTYTHHLYALHGGYPAYPAAQNQGQGYTPALAQRKGAAGGGRRRSVSIRMPPTYGPHRGRPAPAAYKFDPFADDEAATVPASVTSPLTGSAQANHASDEEVVGGAEPVQRKASSAPYTIHIPAAQPTEIQQYTPPASPRPAHRTAALRSLIPINGPLPGTAPPTAATAPPQNQRSSTAPPAQRQAQAAPNLSKIVAGILLNRVHAVGKPMRRRVLQQNGGDGEKGSYRKSCLSSVVSVEA